MNVEDVIKKLSLLFATPRLMKVTLKKFGVYIGYLDLVGLNQYTDKILLSDKIPDENSFKGKLISIQDIESIDFERDTSKINIGIGD